MFLVAVSPRKKNTPSESMAGHGVARPRRARTKATATAERKNSASSKCRTVGGFHSVTVFRMAGFVEMFTT